jgi:GT2 family glycosyltransferase
VLSLCAVIPATDSRPTSSRCIQSVRAATQAPEELIVVDKPAGLGPAAARNAGARRATADVLVFVDSDVEVHADAFARIRAAFAEDPDLVGVFGSYDDEPEGTGLISDFRNLLHHHVHHSAAGPATTFWAGLGAVRREAFLNAGGFDEVRFSQPSIEDIDLGMRLVSNGERILLDPRIQGKHLKRWTLGSMARTDLLRRGAPWVQLLLERGSGSTTLNLGWRHRASAAVSLAFVGTLLVRKPKPAGAALALLLVLNARFYVLLYKKGGFNQAAVGVPLHLLHHLISVGAVPIGLSQHLLSKLGRLRSK